jgi:hypothetical protein
MPRPADGLNDRKSLDPALCAMGLAHKFLIQCPVLPVNPMSIASGLIGDAVVRS